MSCIAPYFANTTALLGLMADPIVHLLLLKSVNIVPNIWSNICKKHFVAVFSYLNLNGNR